MRRQPLTFIGRELALGRTQDLEPPIVDPISVDHADILGTGSELHPSALDPLLQRRRASDRAAVGQLLGPRHPRAVVLGLSGQSVPGIADRAQSRAAAVIVHLNADRLIKKRLIDAPGGHDCLRCLLGNRSAASIGGSRQYEKKRRSDA